MPAFRRIQALNLNQLAFRSENIDLLTLTEGIEIASDEVVTVKEDRRC